ncbi:TRANSMEMBRANE PROTEIN 214-LIKE [Salix viminalis]|uniref:TRANSMEMBRANE PROTEIN 214-LIKE n=1 Tax=Salix viminalis TaxID=40686 RepID=A0A9Q0U0N1_SALVM|nr:TRANSMEMBRANE PROTEIN 214-LIKE [Salix viminalis]
MDSSESNENHQIASNNNSHPNANDHGWQKVTNAKRQRKQRSAADSAANNSHPIANDSNKLNNVFRSLELQSEDRRLKILESQRAAADAAAIVDTRSRSKHHHRSDDEDDDYDSDEAGVSKENVKAEEKIVKQKKPKKPKVTVADAAAKIDAGDLTAFLSDISGSYEGQQEIQLMRFADYFGRAFSAVSSSQFPWVKMFRENTVAKLVDIPLSHISDAVYKTAADWINQLSIAALGSFVLWSLDSILADLASQQGGSKGSKKGVQQASSKSQVAMFVVLAMVLRRKPDALVNVLPTLGESSKYQGQDKLVVIVWMIGQASHGDLAVGLYSWGHYLLPIVNGKGSNPQSRDIILQSVEKILAAPKARSILVNGAVKKGERLMPPSALEILLRVTFPSSSARLKATERFVAIYPTLKEVALAGAPRSKAMKQVFPELSKEAAGISIWCLTQNADCYKQWDKVYQDNLEASVAVLKRLLEGWKELSVKLAPLDPMRETIKNFRQKNEKGMEPEADATRQALFREADKHCKALSGKLSHGHGCLIGMAVAVIALAAGAAILSSNLESWDWKELPVFISSQFSF